MRCDHLRRVLVVLVAGLILLPTALLPRLYAEEPPPSHVRVVRLSYVSGAALLRRPNSPDWENALVNTPIQEGFELATNAAGFVEVEFENGSTARLGEFSRLLFTQLALSAAGGKLNVMTFEQGYGTFHFQPEEFDHYQVKLGDVALTAKGECRFRTDLAPDRLRVEMFRGTIEAATAKSMATVSEGEVLERRSGSTESAFNIRTGIDKDDWDKWTEARDKQAHLAEMDDRMGTFGMRYGWNDLNTYGEWVRVPGGGFGWSPYAPVGWSPYSFGRWQWYPGSGWVWVSGEPWGWLPYNCGQWFDNASFGWYWMMPMDGCPFWQPSLVEWFGGPGWIGWAPHLGSGRPGGFHPPARNPGSGPRPPFHPSPVSSGVGSGNAASLIAHRNVTAVPTSVFESRQMITPQVLQQVSAGPENRMEHPPSQPAHPAALAAAPVPAASREAGKAFAHHSSAPPSILMGGDAGKESALLFGLHLRSRNEPLRARGGTTLGGRYPVRGSQGEFRGETSKGGMASAGGATGGTKGGGSGSSPVVVSHTSGGGASRASSSGGWSGGGGGSGGGSSVSGGISAGSAHASGGGGGSSGGHH